MAGKFDRTVHVDAVDQTNGMTLGEIHSLLDTLVHEYGTDPLSTVYASLHFGAANQHGSRIFGVTVVTETTMRPPAPVAIPPSTEKT